MKLIDYMTLFGGGECWIKIYYRYKAWNSTKWH